MQISELEVTKLTAAENIGLAKQGEAEIELKVTPEDLPKTIEPDAAEVARVLEIVKSAPDVREDVVMRLKERVENGEYDVSGKEIADMMIRRIKADRVR